MMIINSATHVIVEGKCLYVSLMRCGESYFFQNKEQEEIRRFPEMSAGGISANVVFRMGKMHWIRHLDIDQNINIGYSNDNYLNGLAVNIMLESVVTNKFCSVCYVTTTEDNSFV